MGEHRRVDPPNRFVGEHCLTLPAAAASGPQPRRQFRALAAHARGLSILLALGLAACSHGAKEQAPGAASAVARPVPVDALRPGEIAEGKELAFGFPLPRDMQVTARFSDAIFATGSVGFEALTNYVRERLDAERVDTGPVKTVFASATLKADPNRRVLVEVTLRSGVVEIVVRDETPKPVDPGLSSAEIWKRAGLGPDGGVLVPPNE